MKRNILTFITILSFSFSLPCFGQCQKLYDKGMELMENKQYSEAIDYFCYTGECDQNLSGECFKKIKECNEQLKAPVKKNIDTDISQCDTLYLTSEDGDPYNVDFKLKGGYKKIRVICPGSDYSIINKTNQESLKLTKLDDGFLLIEATKVQKGWEGTITLQSNRGSKRTIDIHVEQYKTLPFGVK